MHFWSVDLLGSLSLSPAKPAANAADTEVASFSFFATCCLLTRSKIWLAVWSTSRPISRSQTLINHWKLTNGFTIEHWLWVAPLPSVVNLTTRWCHLHWLQIWSTHGVICLRCKVGHLHCNIALYYKFWAFRHNFGAFWKLFGVNENTDHTVISLFCVHSVTFLT